MMFVRMPGEQLRADPVRVASNALAAPADDRPADQVAGRLVPVRRDAADDGVVFRIPGRIHLAVEHRAHERIEGEIDRVDGLEHDQRVARDRRVDVVRVQPLHRFRRSGDGRCRLAEFDGQRLDDLDFGLGQPDEHPGQLHQGAGPGLHAHAFAALARVVELELVLLSDDLFGHRQTGLRDRSGRGRDGLGRGVRTPLALQELERHVRASRLVAGSAVMVAGRSGGPVLVPDEDHDFLGA